MKKKLLQALNPIQRHWVGDGFPVRTIFSYNDHELAQELSPFLLMDYAGPEFFEPTDQRRGVGEHPHRGFETVTIVYDGEVEHRDSAGGGGFIGPGDVQWMTAASGLVHEEFHGKDFAKNGGRFELIQLWVNLPAKDKMSAPQYQTLQKKDIPTVMLAQDAGLLRVIAGSFQGHRGPAKTFTPIELWDLQLRANTTATLPLREHDSAAIFLLSGEVRISSGETFGDGTLLLFERQGTDISFEIKKDSKALVLSGQPLNESIVGYGPFVMNSREEITQAMSDFRAGKMGQLSG